MTTRTIVQILLLIFAVILFVLAALSFGEFVIHGWSDATDHALEAGGLVCVALFLLIGAWPPKAA